MTLLGLWFLILKSLMDSVKSSLGGGGKSISLISTGLGSLVLSSGMMSFGLNVGQFNI